jgi:protein-disulfide isomerase
MKKFIPTMVVSEVSESSKEGKALIEKYELNTIPSFVFDKKIQEASFFQEEQVQEIFDRRGNGLVLDSTALGIPVGRYLKTPEEKKGDIVIGKKDAQVKLVTFFDFQCSYSKIFYEAAKEARNEFNGDQLAMIYKNFPLDLQGQGISAALVGQCAYQQGRFEEMADLLFANQKQWSEAEDFKIFDQYALKIGLDKKQFDECVETESNKDLILESIEQGNKFGIAGTPASFIGKEFLNGIFQKEDIIETIKNKLE